MARVPWPSLASLKPQACRSMWEWTRKVNFSATPALACADIRLRDFPPSILEETGRCSRMSWTNSG